jgi:urease accessory protein UreF
MSAAVRLGVCGPMEAQAMQARLAAGTLEPLLLLTANPSPPGAAKQTAPPLSNGNAAAAAAAEAGATATPPPARLNAEGWAPAASDAGWGRAAPEPGAVRHTAPLAELLQATQDRLYSRLFNS